MTRSLACATLCTLVGLTAARAADPTAPKLEELARQSPAPSEQPTEPARRIPDRVIICIDRGGGRCWSAPRESECRAGGRGDVYRAVPNTEAGNAGRALADCWAEVGGERRK